jgi:hypothetical protein
MEKSSRRVFVQRLGAFALMPLARSEPDLILSNGNIWTVDAKNPLQRAMLSFRITEAPTVCDDSCLGLKNGSPHVPDQPYKHRDGEVMWETLPDL